MENNSGKDAGEAGKRHRYKHGQWKGQVYWTTIRVKVVRCGTDGKVFSPRGRLLGIKSNVSLTGFLSAVFEQNETLPKWRKLTDEAIKRALLVEFPESRSIKRLAAGEIGIGYFRSKFNGGEYTAGNRPKMRSRPFDYKGRPINPTTFRPYSQDNPGKHKRKETSYESRARARAEEDARAEAEAEAEAESGEAGGKEKTAGLQREPEGQAGRAGGSQGDSGGAGIEGAEGTAVLRQPGLTGYFGRRFTGGPL